MNLKDEARITVWEKPGKYFMSSHGRITHQRYLELEKERVSRHGRRTKIVIKNGESALFRVDDE